MGIDIDTENSLQPTKKQNWFFLLIYQRTMLVLGIFISVGVVIAVYAIQNMSHELITTSALEEAMHYTQVLREFRTLYTDEVVQRVRDAEINITHDYRSQKGAIPLPATMTMLLGSRITRGGDGISWRLYSQYPFPWRTDGGPHDEFERNALAHLREFPDEPFYRVEDSKEGPVLRYAVADVMNASCVSCHNEYPDTPKSDWKVGDVRGALEFTRPMNAVTRLAQTSIHDATLLAALVVLFGFTMLAVVDTRLRKSNSKATELAMEKDFANKQLEKQNQVTKDMNQTLICEAKERENAEKGLREALAESEKMRWEVERFNDLAVDRELRIIDLKRSINQLLRESGSPERYSLNAIDESTDAI